MAFVEILLATVAAWALGSVWYLPLFGKAWRKHAGLSLEDVESNMLRTHGLAFLMMACIACGLNIIINYHSAEEQTFLHGATHGILAAIFYAVPAVAIHYLYQRKSIKLFLIDGMYIVLFFALQGGVLAALKLG